MTRSQLRLLSRTLGVLAFGVCFAVVVDQSQDEGSGPRPAPSAQAAARRAPVRLPNVVVPTALGGTGSAAAPAAGTPSAGPAGSGTSSDAAPAGSAPATPATPVGVPFTGLPTVGAVFVTGPDGKADLHHHFCTGTVVDSPGGDVIATAAHCLSDPANGIPSPGAFVFVPGYHDGQEPYGEWTPVKVSIDPHWAANSNPDYDVAFVRVQQSGGSGKALADQVGAQHIAFSQLRPAQVGAIGYPSSTEQPVACTNTLKVYAATQSEFDCVGFADGSSGGPMLAGIDATTGLGTMVGVIGGYQEGGDSPDVSYSCYFGDDVKALYQQAIGAG
ncbi:trypsin-like serine protease [Streptacidiphilus sp. EB129]|uniref:trypsin-like serine peptidase n=1 Tax=Streptacidiphilus sp. EB129 TaxID=3156262 RepID=UPI003518E192